MLLGEDVRGANRVSFDTASSPEVGMSNRRGSYANHPQPRPSLSNFPFEHFLENSRVYRRSRINSVDPSTRSSVARTHAWSIFSGLSLGQISNISVIALPLYADDIGNRQHYNFGLEMTELVSGGSSYSSLSVPTTTEARGTTVPNCLEIELHLSQLRFYPFAEHISEQRNMAGENVDSFATLIAIFRQGAPLLALLDQAIHPGQSVWASRFTTLYPTLGPKPSTWAGWRMLTESIATCARHITLPPRDWFTVADLMDENTERQLKARLHRINLIMYIAMAIAPFADLWCLLGCSIRRSSPFHPLFIAKGEIGPVQSLGAMETVQFECSHGLCISLRYLTGLDFN